MRCQRGGFECTGVKGAAFIDGRSGQPMDKSGVLPESSVGSSSSQPGPSDDELEESSAVVPAVQTAAGSLVFLPSIKATLNLSAHKENIYISYTKTNLFQGGVVSQQYGAMLDTPNLFNSPTLSLVEQCLLSLAKTYFGSQHQEPDILREGLALYTTSLKALNEALGDPMRIKSDEVLESVVVLGLFEVRSTTDVQTYISDNHS